MLAGIVCNCADAGDVITLSLLVLGVGAVLLAAFKK